MNNINYFKINIEKPEDVNKNFMFMKLFASCLLIIAYSNRTLLEYRGTELVNWIFSFTQILSIGAVNIYIILNCWFSVGRTKIDFKSIAKLYFIAWFYNLINMSIALGMNICEANIENYLRLFFPVLTHQYWFVNNLIVFLLVAPYISMFLSKLNKQQCQIFVGIVLLVGPIPSAIESALGKYVYSISGMGYWFINFIFLFICIFYIKKYVDFKKLNCIWFLVSFILVILVCGFLDGFFFQKTLTSPKYGYSTLWVWILSFSIFFFFMTVNNFNIKNNRLINGIQLINKCALGAYIFRTSDTNNFMRKNWLESFVDLDIFLNYFILMIINNLICFTCDYIRQLIICYSMDNKYYKEINSKVISKYNKIFN
ncbi:MAG: hypothetical protein ACRC42_04930 [Mycoplasma sp.]